MAKIARWSVASNPSSLTSNKNLASSLSGTVPTTPDPLRTSGYQFTTRTISNESKRHGNKSKDQSTSSTSNNNNAFDNVNTNSTNSTLSQNSSTKAILSAERERVRMEFYATYDVMTGVRIAATLGGFFGLMVFLIVWKSRSNSNDTLRVLKDPKIAAVAAACMQEEEEREIQEAIEATGLSIFPDEYDAMLYRRQRMLSVGNVSAPPILHRGFRFSSIGGGAYSSLLESGRRYSFSGSRRKSASESSRVLSAYPMGSSFGTEDYFIETDDELENEFNHISSKDDPTQQHAFLEVPITGQESRRSSAMTCCSTESSYLERRCSALTLGLSSLPSTFEESSKNKRGSSTDIWDYYYPDIHVISATPKTSPCPSERSLYDKKGPMGTNVASALPSVADNSHYKPNGHTKSNETKRRDTGDRKSSLQSTSNKSQQNCSKIYGDNNELKLAVKRKMSDSSSVNNNSCSNVCNSSYKYSVHYLNENVRRAPLASISSFKLSSVDYQDSDLKSLGSDSVFVETYADTDDDMEQFSTDSDELSIGGDKPEVLVLKESVQRRSFEKTCSSGTESTHLKSEEIPRPHIKRGRPVLQRHRTISVSSNDKAVLLPQQSQEIPLLKEDYQISIDPELNRISNYPTFVSSPPSLSRRDTSSLPTDEATVTTTTTPSTLNTEIRKASLSFSYNNNNGSCSNISKRSNQDDRIRKTKEISSGNSNNECVEVNVIIENRPTNIISPSVILELPVIALPSQDDEDDPPRDPSLPGTSRKWSKETLF